MHYARFILNSTNNHVYLLNKKLLTKQFFFQLNSK